MTDVPIQFFQVGATAIPTLLIAVAVGVKQGAAYAEMFSNSSRLMKCVTLFGLFTFLVSVVGGELAALTALYQGKGTPSQAIFVYTGIGNTLAALVAEYVQPMAKAMSFRGGLVLWILVLLAWIGVVVYGIILI